MVKSRIHVFVEGKVQGVFYRAETQSTARLYDLKGWVRNLQDGRVEAVFEGEGSAVEKMVAWCSKGPAYSAVKNIKTISEDFKNEFDGFSIVY